MSVEDRKALYQLVSEYYLKGRRPLSDRLTLEA